MKNRTELQVRVRLLNHGDDKNPVFKRVKSKERGYAIVLKKTLVAYKGVTYDSKKPDKDGYGDDPSAIVTLLIPAGATVIKGGEDNNKLRASSAKVVRIIGVFSHKNMKEAYTLTKGKFVYKVGQTVRPKGAFNQSPSQTCGSGIHFFLDRNEAVEWVV